MNYVTRSQRTPQQRGNLRLAVLALLIVGGVLLSSCGAEGLGVAAAEGQAAVEQVNTGRATMDRAQDVANATDGHGSGNVPGVTNKCPDDADAMRKVMQFNVGMSKLTPDEQTAAKTLYRAAVGCGDTEIMDQYTAWAGR